MDASCKTKNVLVIDDDESIVDLIQKILRQHNYQPITATLYTTALDALEHENPDLLLLDLFIFWIFCRFFLSASALI